MLDFYDLPIVKRREYSQLFTGSNQEDGHSNIFLGFAAATKEIVFEPNKITFFHYAKFAPAISIHASNLVAEGATAGTTPLRSDKIYKKQAGYSKYTAWGSSSGVQTGTWLCTWLSGNNDSTDSIWMDRYYDPGYITLTDALTAITESYIKNSPILYDIISEQSFQPGVQYMYHHFGDVENTAIVDSLADYLVLNIKDWSNDDTGTLDSSNAIVKQKINDIEDTSVLSLSGSTQTEYSVNSDESWTPTDYLTLNIWAKATDWNNLRGNQIFGNYFRGGWGLHFETKAFNPLIAIWESSQVHILFGNTEGKFYIDKPVDPLSALNLTFTKIAVTSDMYTWVISNGTPKRLYRLDYNGEILTTITFPSTADLTDLAINQSNNVFVFEKSSANVYQYDVMGTFVQTISVPSTHNKVAFTLENEMVTKNCLALLVDMENNTWSVTEPAPLNFIITKNLAVVPDIYMTSFESIKVDPYNNIWILHNHNTQITKINAKTTVSLLSTVIGTVIDAGNAREIGFTKEYIDDQFKDFAWIIQGGHRELYKIDLECNLIETIDLTNKLTFPFSNAIRNEDIRFNTKGDFAGTDWAIKYRYPQFPENSLAYNIDIVLPTGAIQKKKLKFNINKLGNNMWNMFTLTFNTATGRISIYCNGSAIATETVPIGSKIYYKYKNNLVFGGNASKFTNLDEELQVSQYHFDGFLAEPSIYNRELSSSDINHIFRQKSKAKKIIWNAPINKQVYIEEIERFFRHKIPGSKSNFYNINLKGLNITDLNLRGTLEDIIKNTVKKISPVNTELYKIKWT